jgi:tRNA(Ile)-lysidine synthase
VTALTVDHGLRAGAAAEAATVARHCAAAGIPHVTLCWVGNKPKANIQAAARAARYGLMADWCAANAVAFRGPAGDRKLNKAKSTGRIDGMVALAMAINRARALVAEPDISGWLASI